MENRGGAAMKEYKDPQRGSTSYFPLDMEAAERALIVQEWRNKKPGEELWFVFVTCILPGQELRFVYPIGGFQPTESAVLECALSQHEHFHRPPISGKAELLHVTQEVVHALTSKTTGAVGTCCDFCSQDPVPLRSYDAEDFVLFSGNMSVGAWGACPDCAALIERGDKEALALRMAKVGGADTDRGRQLAMRQVNDFFEHRRRT